MAEGIRINDAALEISPEGLESLVNSRGTEVKVTKLDLTVSPEAIATLLARFGGEGGPPPTAEVSDGRLQLTRQQGGARSALDLQLGSVRLELSAEGIRLVTSPATKG